MGWASVRVCRKSLQGTIALYEEKEGREGGRGRNIESKSDIIMGTNWLPCIAYIQMLHWNNGLGLALTRIKIEEVFELMCIRM